MPRLEIRASALSPSTTVSTGLSIIYLFWPCYGVLFQIKGFLFFPATKQTILFSPFQ
jgi:hypothetical protein